MARSRRGAAELSLLLSTTALSLFIAALALVGIRFLSGAVETPESAMEADAERYIELLKGAGAPQCVHPYLADKIFVETAKPSVYAVLRETWVGWLGEEKLRELMAGGVVCPTEAELAAQGASYETQDCGEAKRLAFARTEVALMKYRESHSEEDLATFKNLYATSLANNPKTPYGCTVTDANFAELISEERGKRCFSHDDCTVDWYCVVPHDDTLSRAERLAASLLGREGSEGTCNMISSNTQCWRNADCADGFTCEPAPQIGAPCTDGFCPLPTLGKCAVIAHGAPAEEEQEGTDSAETICGPSIAEVRDWMIENGMEASPSDVLAQQEQILNEEYGATRAEQEACLVEGAKTNESTESEESDAVIASAELAPILSDATMKLVTLMGTATLPENVRTLVQEGLSLIGDQLGILSEGGTVDVLGVREMLSRIREILPEDVVRQFQQEHGAELEEEASFAVQSELHKVREMVGWIFAFLDALEDGGYPTASLQRWRADAEEVSEGVEGVLDICMNVARGSAGGAEQCGMSMEEIFGPLVAPGGMKDTIEGSMQNPDSEEAQIVMMAMQQVGPPPMDEGGQGGPGRGGDVCGQIGSEFGPLMQQCMEQNMPAGCFEGELPPEACGEAAIACEQGILPPELFQVWRSVCVGDMRGQEPTEDLWNREQESLNAFADAYPNAVQACCSMGIRDDRDFQWCVMDFIPPALRQMRPEVPSHVEECPESQFTDVCASPRDDAVMSCQRPGGSMDPYCMAEHFSYVPAECAEDPFWGVARDMENWQNPDMGMPGMPGSPMYPGMPGGGMNGCGYAQQMCREHCMTGNCGCESMCDETAPMPYPGGPMMPGGPYMGPGGNDSGLEACTREKARCVDACGTDTACMGRCPMCSPSGGMTPGMPGGTPGGSMSCDQMKAQCRSGCTASPNSAACTAGCETMSCLTGGMPPGGTPGMMPGGQGGMTCQQGCDAMMNTATASQLAACRASCTTMPGGTYMPGMMPSGTYPSGMMPSGMYPSGTMPSGMYPSGGYPSGSYPMPSGSYPMPSGSYPSGGTYTPPPDGGSYTPPPSDGGSYTPPPPPPSEPPPPPPPM